MALSQDGTSHYLKGLVALLCYLAIGVSFFVFKSPTSKTRIIKTSPMWQSSSSLSYGLVYLDESIHEGIINQGALTRTAGGTLA